MPTADDYTSAASRFRAKANRLDEAARFPSGTATAFGAAPIRTALDDQAVIVASDVSIAADECRRLAITCDARAAVCAEYRRAVNRFWIELAGGRPSFPPSRPASWVD